MRVIEAQACRPRREPDAPLAIRRNVRRAFFRSAVDIGAHDLAMPMQLLGNIAVVVDVDGDLLAFFEAQQRPGKLAVVSSRGDDVARRYLDRVVAMRIV